MKRPGVRVVVLAVAVAGMGGTVFARDETRRSPSEIDFDDPPETAHRITDALRFGAKADLVVRWESDFDLVSGRGEDGTIADPTFELALSFTPPGSRLRGFASLTVSSEIRGGNLERDPAPTRRLELDLAFVAFANRRFTLGVGRQRFEDERQWWYDENLDGVRLDLRAGGLELELSATRRELVGDDLLNRDDKDRTANFAAVVRRRLGDDGALEGYLLFRDRLARDEPDPVFVGARAAGEASPRIDYWADAALVRGGGGDLDIRGYGFDLGATFDIGGRLEPSLTLGVAFGSGDGNPADGVDRGFRQTGLQDNDAGFGGIASFKYYGEVLELELSNLRVLTAGVGLRPLARGSLDLVYHHYRQHRAAPALGDARVTAAPTGGSRDLGHGLDLIFAYEGWRRLDLTAVVGAFVPGDAFAEPDPAFFGEIEVSFTF